MIISVNKACRILSSTAIFPHVHLKLASLRMACAALPVIDLDCDVQGVSRMAVSSTCFSEAKKTWAVSLQTLGDCPIDLTEDDEISRCAEPEPSKVAMDPLLQARRHASGAIPAQCLSAPGNVHGRLRQGLLSATMQRLRFRGIVARRGRTRGRKAGPPSIKR